MKQTIHDWADIAPASQNNYCYNCR